MAADPGVVLVVEGRAILAFSEEDLPTAGMDFCVLGYVVNSALVDCPAIVLGLMLGHFFSRIEHTISIFYDCCFTPSFCQKPL